MPIWWTNLMVDSHQIDVQKYINALDWSQKWFTVVQMDDGIQYKIPNDTLVFSAGGSRGSGNLVPIPLISSPMPKEVLDKENSTNYLASFVGSMTHPIRNIAYSKFNNNNAFYFNKPKAWSQSVSPDSFSEFINITKQSKFCLAFAGYGDTSFRLYQAMELGVVPVYIAHTKHWLPWSDEINWEDFSVLLMPKDISNLYDILLNISEDRRLNMLENIKKLQKDYFSLDGVVKNILKRI